MIYLIYVCYSFAVVGFVYQEGHLYFVVTGQLQVQQQMVGNEAEQVSALQTGSHLYLVIKKPLISCHALSPGKEN